MTNILSFLSEQQFNALRIPFSADLALNYAARSPLINLRHDAKLTVNRSIEMLDQLIQACSTRGILVLLDLHKLAHLRMNHSTFNILVDLIPLSTRRASCGILAAVL